MFRLLHCRTPRIGALLSAALLAAAATLTGATAAGAGTGHGDPSPDLGPNVVIFDPDMPLAEIQATVDTIAAEQVDDEMGEGHHALLFEPGTYGTTEEPLILEVGYYTEVAGLGALPTDVVINGHVDVYNRCLTPDNCIALVNFWRSLSNPTIRVEGAGLDDCRAQAAPVRRVKVEGPLTLMDYCTGGPQYAAAGYRRLDDG